MHNALFIGGEFMFTQRAQRVVALLLLTMGGLLAACAGAPAPAPPSTAVAPTAAAATAPARPEVLLATTTSTQDSGLLDVLVPDFAQHTGYHLKVIAVGSGQALQMGQQGNADVLLVHSPDAEQAFMQTGAGLDRRLVMHNDFVLVGPPGDPAHVTGKMAVAALQAIAATAAPFVSRGDNSGTNALELKLWKQAAIDPSKQSWYILAGQGMGATLSIASEKDAYTISDRATYLAFQAKIQSRIMVEHDPVLLNIYHVIRVNPQEWPGVNAAGAQAFADYLLSPATQHLIGQFGVDKYGQPLFVPDAGKAEDQLGP
jgi:tungstate transport system substrate-binding protein